jgi:hypothetical protein
VPFLSAPGHDLLASRLAREALLPADSAVSSRGQVLDLICSLCADAGADVKVVQLVDEHQAVAQRAEQIADLVGHLDLAEPRWQRKPDERASSTASIFGSPRAGR